MINFENMAGLEKTESPVIYQYIVERMEESDDDGKLSKHLCNYHNQ